MGCVQHGYLGLLTTDEPGVRPTVCKEAHLLRQAAGLTAGGTGWRQLSSAVHAEYQSVCLPGPGHARASARGAAPWRLDSCLVKLRTGRAGGQPAGHGPLASLGRAALEGNRDEHRFCARAHRHREAAAAERAPLVAAPVLVGREVVAVALEVARAPRLEPHARQEQLPHLRPRGRGRRGARGEWACVRGGTL